MPDYIPAPDGDFNAWQANFVTYANANLAGLGLVAGREDLMLAQRRRDR